MTLKAFETHYPTIAKSAYVDDSAIIAGDVTIGKDSSVWPLVVIRGDVNKITIGARTSIQDGVVIHVTHASQFNPDGHPLTIGNDVTIGHKALLHGCNIGDECLIGMGAIVMDDAVIEPQVVLGAGSIVPPGRTIESGFLWVGSPARKIRRLTEEEISYFKYSASNYVSLKNRYLATER